MIRTLLFIITVSFIAISAQASELQCQDLFPMEKIAAQALKAGRKVDIDEVTAKPVSIHEFEGMVGSLIHKKLLWFSLEDFAQEQIKNWNSDVDVKNFLSYKMSVFVRTPGRVYYEVTLPIISPSDIMTGGFQCHNSMCKKTRKESLLAGAENWLDEGAVIIERQPDRYLVEDSKTYGHMSRRDEPELVGANPRKSLILKRQQ